MGRPPSGAVGPWERHLATAFGWSVAPWAWTSPAVTDGSSLVFEVGFLIFLDCAFSKYVSWMCAFFMVFVHFHMSHLQVKDTPKLMKMLV